MRRLAVGGSSGSNVRVERCMDFTGADTFWESVRLAYRFSLVHDQAYFDWRYAACPTPFRIFRASRVRQTCRMGGDLRQPCAEPIGFVTDSVCRSGRWRSRQHSSRRVCVRPDRERLPEYLYLDAGNFRPVGISHDALTREPASSAIPSAFCTSLSAAWRRVWTAADLPESGWYLSVEKCF